MNVFIVCPYCGETLVSHAAYQRHVGPLPISNPAPCLVRIKAKKAPN